MITSYVALRRLSIMRALAEVVSLWREQIRETEETLSVLDGVGIRFVERHI